MQSSKHLAEVRKLPCMIRNSRGEHCNQPAEAHHLLRAEQRGTAQKAGDEWAVPLCLHHHTGGVHAYGDEVKFFKNWGVEYDLVKAYARHLAGGNYDDYSSFLAQHHHD